MKLLHRMLARVMRSVEERMIRRLLHQRDAAWRAADLYRERLGMKPGEFDPKDET